MPDIEPSSSNWLARHRSWWAGLLLVGLALLAHGRSVTYPFVNYDDHLFVTASSMTLQGLTWQGVAWAFTAVGDDSNWVPLARLSHMLDVQLYGQDARGHHLTNILLHVANVVLFWLLLCKATGSFWRSAGAAMLLAAHPVHVESVAWISERRDVLSLFFGLLTMLSYTTYVRRQSDGRRAWGMYLLTCAGMALAVMAKPSMVTLPCVLWLLDWWPLRRWSPAAMAGEDAVVGRHRWLGMLLDKLPLLAIVVVSVLLTILAQRNAMAPTTGLPFSLRLVRVPLAYVDYLGLLLWPVDLSPYYADHFGWSLAGAAGAVGLLLFISVAAVRFARSRPYLPTGWLWFLGTLVPMIGLLQVGMQTHACRYAYFTFLGLYILLAWLAGDVLAWWWQGRQPWRKAVAASVAAALALALAMGSYRQTADWSSDESLYHAMRQQMGDHNPLAATHAFHLILEGKPEQGRRMAHRAAANDLPSAGHAMDVWTLAEIHLGQTEQAWRLIQFMGRASLTTRYTPYNVGLIAMERQDHPAAVEAFERVVKSWPDFPEYRLKLAQAYGAAGRLEPMATQLQAVVSMEPHSADTRYLAGMIFFQYHQHAQAAALLEAGLRHPADAAQVNGWYALAKAHASLGHQEQAVAACQQALAFRPQWPEAWNSMGVAYARMGKMDLAQAAFAKAVELDPDNADAKANLARIEARKASSP